MNFCCTNGDTRAFDAPTGCETAVWLKTTPVLPRTGTRARTWRPAACVWTVARTRRTLQAAMPGLRVVQGIVQTAVSVTPCASRSSSQHPGTRRWRRSQRSAGRSRRPMGILRVEVSALTERLAEGVRNGQMKGQVVEGGAPAVHRRKDSPCACRSTGRTCRSTGLRSAAVLLSRESPPAKIPLCCENPQHLPVITR